MSLDNIQLSDQTCSILFGHNLIEDQRSDLQVTFQKKTTIDHLGKNEKHVLVLVNARDSKFLPDDEMELLTNLVSACKLSMADVALVNFSSSRFSYLQFNEVFEPGKVLIFGIDTSELELPFAIPHFQVQKFQEQFYLTAPPLKNFINNNALKKDLWISLQKLFL